MCTRGLWGLVWVMDGYLDYQYVSANKFVTKYIKQAEAVVYFLMVLH